MLGGAWYEGLGASGVLVDDGGVSREVGRVAVVDWVDKDDNGIV